MSKIRDNSYLLEDVLLRRLRVFTTRKKKSFERKESGFLKTVGSRPTMRLEDVF
jgi:hypothetical protein